MVIACDGVAAGTALWAIADVYCGGRGRAARGVGASCSLGEVDKVASHGEPIGLHFGDGLGIIVWLVHRRVVHVYARTACSIGLHELT